MCTSVLMGGTCSYACAQWRLRGVLCVPMHNVSAGRNMLVHMCATVLTGPGQVADRYQVTDRGLGTSVVDNKL